VRVKVLYFGILKDRFGVAEEQVELPGDGNVGELLGLLRGRTSNSAMESGKVDGAQEERLWRSLAVAVNQEYSSHGAVLRDGDEVALLPPVSGGCFAYGEKRASLGTARTAKSELRSQRTTSMARRSRCSRRNGVKEGHES
jgi:molybdopterin converting factor small subunit